MNKIEWKAFAEMNGLSVPEFESEIALCFMAMMSKKLDDCNDSDAVIIRRAGYSVVFTKDSDNE